jgi:hypothetical protein
MREYWSEELSREVGLGKIVYGENYATLKVKTPALASDERKLTDKIGTLLASPSPPDLVLNRHCAECEFQNRCRQKAIEKDDLSLLSGMAEKERADFNSKGIFTVTQLSHTFRSRRRPQGLRDKRERYHQSLKALAIREKKIHIVGSPEMKIALESRRSSSAGSGMIWACMLAYITGTVDQELLLRNEYLAAENRILRAQIKGRLLLSDAEKATLAEIAQRLGRKALEELSAVAKPDTLLARYRKLIANKFDGSKFRKSRGRPRVDEETERLVVRMAKENPGWGYDRIVHAMANLGHRLPNGSRRRVEKTLSVLTWRYWRRPTSLRWKCLRSED